MQQIFAAAKVSPDERHAHHVQESELRGEPQIHPRGVVEGSSREFEAAVKYARCDRRVAGPAQYLSGGLVRLGPRIGACACPSPSRRSRYREIARRSVRHAVRASDKLQ